MYTQVKKSKENKSSTAANSIVQKKHSDHIGKSLIDNRNKVNSVEDNRKNQGTTQLVSKGVIQCWPPKDWYVPGPGKGFIPFMGAQFDPKFRDPKHQELLNNIPKDQCPVKTFGQENDFASKYPYEGSKSMLGDAGIGAHKAYAKMKGLFGEKI